MNPALAIPIGPATELAILAESWATILIRLVTAVVCGVLLGYERKRRQKPIGLKTMTLICVGSTTYIIAAELIMLVWTTPTMDPARVAGQLVTGIGFIGAGAIFRERETVRGLTSAAMVWFAGAIGILIGVGFPLLAFVVTLLACGLLILLRWMEDRWMNDDEKAKA